MPLSLDQQRRCALRELALRQRVYPRFVAAGRMSPAQAADELCAMAAIVDTLTQLVLATDPQPSLFQGEHAR